MIRRGVKIQLFAFLLIGSLGIIYAGLSLIGVDAINKPMRVVVHASDAGGVFPSAEVTYRGVTVGHVKSLTLTPTGVDINLDINKGEKIPSDLHAVTANKSAVGEQYIDLQPTREGAPYLRSGSEVPIEDVTLALPLNQVLVDFDKLVSSVNLTDLQTVVTELGNAFSGTGPDLQTLITDGNSLTANLTQSLPDTIRLINNAKINLASANATAGSLIDFANGLTKLSDTLVTSDTDIRTILGQGVQASQQLDSLIQQVQPGLYPLLGNLLTINSITNARMPGTQQLLTILPGVADRLLAAIQPTLVQFGFVVDNAQPPCVYSTPRRLPTDTSPSPTVTNQDCSQADLAAGLAQRGAKEAPRPAGDTTANDPGATQVTPTSTQTGVGIIDPTTGTVFSQDGPPFVLDNTNLVAQTFGANSWAGLLLAPSRS